MVKQFYIVAAAIFIFASVQAQTRTRLLATANYVYDPFSNADTLCDSMIYLYSNGRGGAGGEKVFFDTGTHYTYTPGMDNRRLLQTFLPNDSLKTSITQLWVNGAFEDKLLHSYTYNTVGKILSDSIYNMYYFGNEQSITVLYTYTTAGNLETKATVNIGGGISDTFSFEQYIYNTAGQLDVWLLNDNILPTRRTLYSYNTAGQRIKRVEQIANGINWDDQDITDYTYDAGGNIAARYVTRAGAGSQPDTNLVEYNTYNSGNKLTSRMLMKRQSGQPLDRSDSTYYTYNANNQCTYTRTVKWMAGSWQNSGPASATRYYYQVYTPSIVSAMKKAGGKLNLYPVPANNTLNIDVQWITKQAYTLTIADMQGRVVLQSHEHLAQQAINISHIPEGAYNLILQGDKGAVQHSRFTVVRQLP